MKFDINEARALVEAAKKRGAIREAGSVLPPVSAPPSASEKPAAPAVLPDWLREEIQAPSSPNKPITPEWRS